MDLFRFQSQILLKQNSSRISITRRDGDKAPSLLPSRSSRFSSFRAHVFFGASPWHFVPMFGIVTKSYRNRSICVPGASTGSTIGESAAVVRYAAKYAIGHSTDVILLVLLVDMLLVMLLDIYICIYLYL